MFSYKDYIKVGIHKVILNLRPVQSIGSTINGTEENVLTCNYHPLLIFWYYLGFGPTV